MMPRHRLAWRAAIGRGDSDGAIEILEKAVAQLPKSAEAHYWLGCAYGVKVQAGGMFAAAKYASNVKDEFEKAVALDPKYVDARYSLVQVYAGAPGIMGGSFDKALELLRAGKPARFAKLAAEEEPGYRALQLLTAKPVVYVCNVDEASAAAGNAMSKRIEDKARAEGAGCVVISAKIEAEFAGLAPQDRDAFLHDLGLQEAGLNRLIREGYRVLGLIPFFTVGPKEARAWTVTRGTKAPKAAGVIHTDFEKGFIRAETIAYDDFSALGGELPAKEAGKMRLEGKEYVVKDGDVMHFRFAN